ncbi:MAG: hypothetical protein JWL97_1234 [Gemmatimonadales bacterium]|nr:hypothetical protein [Gemmatimonadales bacterium]
MLPLLLFAILIAVAVYIYRQRTLPPEQAPTAMTDERIRQEWRKLGFYCEMDSEKKLWTLTGSRAGLLYFPDLLLGYVADPKNATDTEHVHYGPYGTLEVMTYPDAGFDGHAIRGSLVALTHLAELVEVKLASAEPGSPILIREEYAADSPYSLMLDVRADGFDPSSADRERLGAATEKKPEGKKPEGKKPEGKKPEGGAAK